MNFKHIIEVLKSASRGRVKNPLGRWNLDNHKHTKLKSNYANEDHCGSCAEYMILKQQLHTVKLEQQQKQEQMYKYLIGPDALPDTNKFKV
jgi:hypothetical protein